MKKFMSVLLAFAMVFACLPIQGGAAEETAASTTVEQTITFDDTAKRTQFDTIIQVWEENGITVTNNKGSSTSNVADYAAPARFYKSSELIVACKNMIQITFVGAGSSTYKTPIGNTLTAEGYTPTVDGDKYTITFAEPVDSFSISSFTAQVRMSSIIVTTMIDQSTADTPVEVSFDLNYDGATGAPGNAAVMVGSFYGPLPEVSREGFTFAGWFTNSSCTGEAVTEETIVTRAHTLYAKWMADVSFHLNYDGAADAPENTAVAEGGTYGTLPTVSREGYIFGGWFTDIGGAGTAVKATDVVNESHTLYAKWAEAVEGEISEITIDFSTTDQRTGYSTEQQVWTNGDLTFTNDKDTSTTNVGDFSDPVRLYKDSNVTIACAGMTQIVIVSNGTSDYKANLTGSLDAAGVTYTTSDDTYTILLAEPADTFTVSLSAGQARFESITVIASTSGGEAPNPTPEETEPTSIEHFTYTTDGTNLTITGYTGTDAEVVISSTYTIDGTEYTVTAIGDSAFHGYTGLISVTIPDSVTSIGSQAFYGCTSLASIIISDSITSVDWHAFKNCIGLTDVYITDIEAWCMIDFASKDANPLYYAKNLYLNGDLLTDVVVPDGVTSIDGYTFRGFVGLMGITMPDSVISIGEYAFNGCSSLTCVTMGNGVVGVDYGAFEGCDNLAYNIYDNAKYLGNAENPYIVLVAATTKDITSCEVNELTRIIHSEAFSGCTSLTNVIIPNSVTSIGGYAFRSCIGLTSIEIPDNMTSIGEGIFWGCEGVTGITIPDGITSIGVGTFGGCTGLRSITIPASVTRIDHMAFDRCTSLATVYYLGSEEQKTEIYISSSESGNAKLINATWLFSQIEESTSTIVKSWGITLNDEVVVKFNMTFTEEILADEAAYVEVKVGGTTTMNMPVSQVTGPLQVPVTASQMTEKITLCIVDGNGVSSETDSFTVRQYCDTILGDEEYAKYHALVKEMLNYGSAAQLYFGKNTGELAGEGITDAGQQEVPTTGGEYVMEGHIEGLECYGATLVLRDKIGLRYYFTGDLTGCTFAVNGVPTELQIGNGNYVELADILPQDLDEDVDLVVTDANGNTINVTYCPMNYIIRMNQKGTDATKAVVKALYNYHLAAKAFSDSQTA